MRKVRFGAFIGFSWVLQDRFCTCSCTLLMLVGTEETFLNGLLRGLTRVEMGPGEDYG